MSARRWIWPFVDGYGRASREMAVRRSLRPRGGVYGRPFSENPGEAMYMAIRRTIWPRVARYGDSSMFMAARRVRRPAVRAFEGTTRLAPVSTRDRARVSQRASRQSH